MVKLEPIKDSYTGIVRISPFHGGAIVDIPNILTNEQNYVHLNKLYFLHKGDALEPIMVRKIWQDAEHVKLIIENIITGYSKVLKHRISPVNYSSIWALLSCSYIEQYFENETQKWYRVLVGNTI